MVLKAPWADDPAPYDLAIIERVVGLAALAFERALFDRQLNQAATTDHLTGLLNRRSFERELRSMPVDDGLPVLVLFADLDGLKEINDRHGHAVGDAVLAAVAARLTSAVRSVDVVGRLGGDEFVVACPGLGDA
ncbi:MAG: GGDEF domain-containing protein, partial [Acidimicrobiia bacterium]